ncbi:MULTISPECIES: cell division protein FtsQ/DivIB [unclassified Rothia (in: high G+C Gram-positive bacteria)]|uniref:cell division protein FtsQ/DivIB n=1 Tax=unclassified Rothia (in: high G+C Gram-positive bacteria) TaxID=2689056 RepID=UPI000AFAE336|nr:MULTISPECIES: cell division protein FtsQ/DivIB [unclassified Rothia (in: high G+C Gram-positive bacteria)]
MSSGLSSEGHSSSRAPKAPRSRARLRAQQVAENAQVEAKKSESVQAESAQSQLTQPQATQPQVVKSAEATGTAKPSEAMKSVDAVKPVEVASSEASAQPSGAQSAATQPSATQSSSSVRHMPRKPVVHKSPSQNDADSSASKSAAAVHSSAQSLKDSVRSALMTGRTVSEVEHAPELFDVEAFEDSSSKSASAQAEKSAEKEVADQKATQKSSVQKSSAGSVESCEESAAQKAEERADKAGEKAVEEPRPTSRFGRWRAEREQQRAAEIEKERERASRQAQRERLRQDPGLDGLRAEERPRKERAPLTRARKLLYTASALAIIAVLYVVLVFFSPLLATQKITVRGASLLETTQVEQKLEPLRGVPLTRIDEKKVRELIGQDNVIRSVQVESRPPHELVVTLKERTAVAVVKQGDTYHTVDSDGVSLLESATQPDTSVPLVRFSGDDPQTSAEFRTISTALSAMPSELLAQVKEAGATSTSSITLTLRDNTTVQWGTAEESELKAKVLLSLRQAIAKRAQEETSSEAQTQKVTVYDVSAPRVPVTR